MKYQVKMNGTVVYATFDTRKMADEYVKMQKEKRRGVGREPAFAALQNWTIVEV